MTSYYTYTTEYFAAINVRNISVSPYGIISISCFLYGKKSRVQKSVHTVCYLLCKEKEKQICLFCRKYRPENNQMFLFRDI